MLAVCRFISPFIIFAPVFFLRRLFFFIFFFTPAAAPFFFHFFLPRRFIIFFAAYHDAHFATFLLSRCHDDITLSSAATSFFAMFTLTIPLPLPRMLLTMRAATPMSMFCRNITALHTTHIRCRLLSLLCESRSHAYKELHACRCLSPTFYAHAPTYVVTAKEMLVAMLIHIRRYMLYTLCLRQSFDAMLPLLLFSAYYAITLMPPRLPQDYKHCHDA